MNQRLAQRTTLPILIAAACLAAFGLTTARTVHAQGTVATTPLLRYGLGSLWCAAYSPDGKHAATGGGDSAVIWSAKTSDQRGVFRLSEPAAEDVIAFPNVLQSYSCGSVQCGAYSPKGRIIATGGGGGAFLWSVETGDLIRKIQYLKHMVSAMVFTPDGEMLITSGSDNAIRFWHPDTGVLIRSIPVPENGICSTLAISATGTVLVGGSYQYVHLWNAETGQLLQRFYAHPSVISDLAVSPDGLKLLTCSELGDEQPILWDLASGTHVSIPHLRAGCVAFSPDGSRMLTGDYDNFSPRIWQIRLWEVETGNMIRFFSFGDYGFIKTAFSPDGTKAVAACYDGWYPVPVVVWDVETGKQVVAFPGHNDTVGSLAFSPDGGKILSVSRPSAGRDTTAKLWDISTANLSVTFDGHRNLTAAASSHDGKHILTGEWNPGQAALSVWDPDTGEESRLLTRISSFADKVCFCPDDSQVLVGTSFDLGLHDFQTGAWIRSFLAEGRKGGVFSQDGKKVLGVWAGAVIVYDTLTGAELRRCQAGNIQSFAISPDSMRILIGYDRFLPLGPPDHFWGVWNAATGDQLTTMTVNTDSVNSVCFSPDGKKALIGSQDRTIHEWDIQTGLEIRTIDAGSPVIHVAYSPDGGFIAGRVEDGVKLWDAATGNLLRVFVGPTSASTIVAGDDSMQFTNDGRNILAHFMDYGVVRLEINPPRVLVVVGGGNYTGNPIADQTNDLGAYAYQTLKRRGYRGEDILYLSAFATAPGASLPPGESAPWRDADGDGLNDVDGWAATENLKKAITGEAVTGASAAIPTDFARSAGRLLILMMDHGARTNSFMAFRLNETQALASTTLDGWLDDLQTPIGQAGMPVPPSPEVTLVVDSCYSGQMVEDCRLTTTELTGGAGWHGSAGHNPAQLAGKKRIVIASTTKDKEAVFLPAPDLTSFMYSFLSSAYMGNSMGEAWRAGKRLFNEFPVADQAPQLDDGTTTSTPGATSTERADKNFFGATWAYGVQSTQDVNRFFPAFEEWTTHTLVSPGDPVTLRAKMLFGQDPLQVVAVVRPPAPEVVSGDPVTNLPHLYLQRQSDDPGNPLYKEWEVTTSTLFSTKGDYTVSFSARFDYERVSNPVFGHVIVSEDIIDTTPIRAILAVDDTVDPDLASCLEHLGPYAFSVYLDRFKDEDGYSRPDWIDYYINPWWDADSTDWPSAAQVLAAINSLPSDIGRLYVHLIGESSAGVSPAEPGVLLAPGDSLAAVDLDSALDAFQSRPAAPAVVLVVDAPGSGAFLPVCRATGSQQRAIFTSGRDTDAAFFLGAPTLTSFSQKFLGAAYQGNDLETAFHSGGSFFNQFLRDFLGGGRIMPQMDDNGDGTYGKADGALASTLYLGRRYAFAGGVAAGLPFILDVSTTRTVSQGGMLTSYTVCLIEGIAPTRVFVQVAERANAGGTITAVPEADFTRDSPTNWTWSGTIAAPLAAGTYRVTFYAAYPDTPQEKLSEPAFSGLVVRKSRTRAGEMWMLYE